MLINLKKIDVFIDDVFLTIHTFYFIFHIFLIFFYLFLNDNDDNVFYYYF